MDVLFIAPVGYMTERNKDNAIHGGYGNAAFGTLKILHMLKEENVIGTLSVIDLSELPIKKKAVDSLLKEYDIAICVSNPLQVSNDVNHFNLIAQFLSLAKKRYLQVVWETENFPKNFDTIFKNDLFTGFLAPSYWGCRELKKRTNKPIFYYPHFVDKLNFHPVDIFEKSIEPQFSVLFIGQYTTRKGVNEAIISFARELGNKEDCQLILKLGYLSPKEIDSKLVLGAFLAQNCKKVKAKIKLIDEGLTNEDLGNLYEASSVLLFCSRGEGFGLPSAEAMLQGLPVIYTDWSATHEVGESPYNYPIKYTVDEAYNMAQYGYEKGLKYAVTSIEDTCKALKFYYDKWKANKKLYYEESRKNVEIIDKKYGVESSKETIVNILNNIPFEEKEEVYAGYKDEKTRYLELEKYAEVGVDREGFKWIMRGDSFSGDILQDEVGANILHENFLLNYIKGMVDKDTIFIDVGAHVGYYSVRLASLCHTVITVEPNIKNTQALFLNTILNNIDNIKPVAIALSDKKGKIFIVDKGSSSYVSESKVESENCYEVEINTFDNTFYQMIQDCTKDGNMKIVVKIDTEGEELKILKGATDSMKKQNITWIIEYHSEEIKNEILEKCKDFSIELFEDIQKIVLKNK